MRVSVLGATWSLFPTIIYIFESFFLFFAFYFYRMLTHSSVSFQGQIQKIQKKGRKNICEKTCNLSPYGQHNEHSTLANERLWL